jgi:hypothetical protein
MKRPLIAIAAAALCIGLALPCGALAQAPTDVIALDIGVTGQPLP